MKTFPMFVKMENRRVVVFGGGEQAAQKVRLILKTVAEILVVSPNLIPELTELEAQGRIIHQTGEITPGLLQNTALAFAASGCPQSDAKFADLARAQGILVNVVDAPDLCDAFTPSIVDRDPVVVAIGTEGTAPVLARHIKTRIEAILEPDIGALAAFAGKMRGKVAQNIPEQARRDFWVWVFEGLPRKLHRANKTDAAQEAIRSAISSPVNQNTASISLITVPASDADLMTLRAVQRLQNADVIICDLDIDPAILELARRDAKRVYIATRDPGSSLPTQWSIERTNRMISREAQSGKTVVQLTKSDISAISVGLRKLDKNAQIELIPGVTEQSTPRGKTKARS